MSKKPRVGVTGSRKGGHFMWWFNSLSLRLFGIRPIRLVAPCDTSILQDLDGLLIGGGDDIGTEFYKGVPMPDVRVDPERDKLELALLDSAVSEHLPILGVCRGAQMINVYLGGSLHQNVYEIYRDAPRRWTPLPAKTVYVRDDTQMRQLLGLDRLRVNSLHTQSIDRLGGSLRIGAHDEYGMIQAIEDPTADFCVGVQWHPEFLIYRRPHRRLFGAFADAVKRHARARQRRSSRAKDKPVDDIASVLS